jgi:ribosomal protein L37AE/L43A
MAKKTLAQTQCSQCGATDFDKRSDGFIECRYCHSVYKMQAEKTASSLIIQKGANVVIGQNARVSVRGGMEIEAGANVEILGRLEIIEMASPEAIAVAKAKLQRVR